MPNSETVRPAAPSYTPDPPEVGVIADELVRRLRPVLGDTPEAEFLDLVWAIARRQHRWNVQARGV